jgi:phage shock protein PspC (stress-responsive transcriptional regulator)
MNESTTTRCPWCAEEIEPGVARCPYCDSVFDSKRPEGLRDGRAYWRREPVGKRIAGVCTGIARELDNTRMVLPLRLFFILTTIFWGFGLILYMILWILMPAGARPADVAPSEAPSVDAPVTPAPAPAQRSGGNDRLLGFGLAVLGVLFMMGAYVGQVGLPMSMPRLWRSLPFRMLDSAIIAPGLIPFLAIVGLGILLFGAFRIFRVMMGCGLILLAGLFLLLFLPFMPHFSWLIPGVLGAGMLVLVAGIVKLIMG